MRTIAFVTLLLALAACGADPQIQASKAEAVKILPAFEAACIKGNRSVRSQVETLKTMGFRVEDHQGDAWIMAKDTVYASLANVTFTASSAGSTLAAESRRVCALGSSALRPNDTRDLMNAIVERNFPNAKLRERGRRGHFDIEFAAGTFDDPTTLASQLTWEVEEDEEGKLTPYSFIEVAFIQLK